MKSIFPALTLAAPASAVAVTLCGVVFSDGIEVDYLDFNSGMTATIGVADRAGMLIQ